MTVSHEFFASVFHISISKKTRNFWRLSAQITAADYAAKQTCYAGNIIGIML